MTAAMVCLDAKPLLPLNLLGTKMEMMMDTNSGRILEGFQLLGLTSENTRSEFLKLRQLGRLYTDKPDYVMVSGTSNSTDEEVIDAKLESDS